MRHRRLASALTSPGSVAAAEDQWMHPSSASLIRHTYHLHHSLSWLQAPYKDQLEGLLLNAVMPCFDSPYGHLRAKACWVAGQYADIDFRGGSGQGQTFGSLFQKVVNAFQDPDLPVRLPCSPLLSIFVLLLLLS